LTFIACFLRQLKKVGHFTGRPGAGNGNIPIGEIMAKAVWNGQLLAESDKCEMVEGNHYFPPEAVKKEFLQPSDTHTTCGWKGIASYHDVAVGGQVNKDAAWYYPDPKPAAKNIAGYVAFWKGVKVEP
jgi:uncharacterized protein (DUF427 family)